MGLSIAVALMPPLCVVVYRIGIALGTNLMMGVRLAQGGGLLFLTNLVAITSSAMLVFLALHIDTRMVREQVRQWRSEDPESQWMQRILDNIPASKRFRRIGSLPGRLLLIVATILLLSIPLSQSFGRLRVAIPTASDNDVLRSLPEVQQPTVATIPELQATFLRVPTITETLVFFGSNQTRLTTAQQQQVERINALESYLTSTSHWM